MKNEKNIIEAEVKEENAIALKEPQNLDKPQHDIEFAHASASRLKDIVSKMQWVSNIKGKEHLQFEAWQTIGKFYGYLVDTDTKEPEYVEYGGVWGFKAHAQVVNEHTGIRVGGASAICMSDEYNWKGRDKYAVMSMAQTRAGSKALRQILSWVVALAGYNPTPLEEIPEEKAVKPLPPTMITDAQKSDIMQLLPKIDKTMLDLPKLVLYVTSKREKPIDSYRDMTAREANVLIDGMKKQALKTGEPRETGEIDMDDADRKIEAMQKQEAKEQMHLVN